MRILLLALLMIIAGLTAAPAQTTHTVRAGETLFSISREYDVSVQQLREWNSLRDNTIRVGQRLYVGTVEDEPGAEPTPDQRSGTIIHTVEPGQTLFRISRMYDVSVEDIRSWNQLQSNTISIGQELTIKTGTAPGDTARPPDVAAETREEPPAAPDREDTTTITEEAADDSDDADYQVAEGPTNYEVRPGDTLYRIAARFNMSVDELIETNQLEDSRLRVGQELRIRSRSAAPPSVTAEWDMESTPQGKFVSYTVGDDDSLDQLLNFHQMDLNDFRALNPGISQSDVRPGDEVILLLASTSPQRNPYQVRTTDSGASQIQVSRYPDERRGRTTTSGDLYNPQALTAAHPSLSLGSVVYVENPETGHGLFVLINDRTSENRLLLSDAAFRALRYTGATSLIAKIDEQPD